MSDKSLSSQQLSFLLFFLLTGSTLVYIPEIAAGRDAWAANLLSSLPGLFILFLILKINKMFPDLSIIEISCLTLGPITGNILNAVFIMGIIINVLVFLHHLSLLLKSVYSLFPDILLLSILIITCIYCLYKGIRVIGYIAEVFIGLAFFLTIAGIIITLPLVQLNQLTPILAAWKPVLAGIVYSANQPYEQLIILALFLPFVKDIKTKYKNICWWYFIAVAMLVIKDVQIVAILGQDLTEMARLPLLKVYRLAGFADFKRVELFFLILWLVSGLIAIIVYYQGLLLSLQQIFRLKNSRALIIPLGMFLIIMTQQIFPSDIVFLTLRRYIPFYTLPVNLFYPAIILLAARLRHKSLAKQGDGSRKQGDGSLASP